MIREFMSITTRFSIWLQRRSNLLISGRSKWFRQVDIPRLIPLISQRPLKITLILWKRPDQSLTNCYTGCPLMEEAPGSNFERYVLNLESTLLGGTLAGFRADFGHLV